jgi:hypothetical protein
MITIRHPGRKANESGPADSNGNGYDLPCILTADSRSRAESPDPGDSRLDLHRANARAERRLRALARGEATSRSVTSGGTVIIAVEWVSREIGGAGFGGRD